MPILSVGNNTVEVICQICGSESNIPFNKIVVADEGVASLPPCNACNSHECIFFHDWVYTGSDDLPDSNNFGAKQMVLIEKIAKRVNLKQKKLNVEDDHLITMGLAEPKEKLEYSDPVEPPDPELVREVVNKKIKASSNEVAARGRRKDGPAPPEPRPIYG